MSPFCLPPCALSPSLFILSSFFPSVAYLRQFYPVRCPAVRLVLAAVPASLLCPVRAISMSPFFLPRCALSPSLFILSSFSPSVAYLRQGYPVRCPAVRLVLAAVPASLLCSVRAISMSPFFLSPCAHSPSLFILSSFSPSVAYLRQGYPVRCPAGRSVLAAVPASLLCSVRAISMSPFFLPPCALFPSLFILSSFSPSVAYLRQCYPVRCPVPAV